MGATGHTGGKIARSLLKAGRKIRVLGRSESKLAELGRAGAEIAVGDARDSQFLSRAFHRLRTRRFGSDPRLIIVPSRIKWAASI